MSLKFLPTFIFVIITLLTIPHFTFAQDSDFEDSFDRIDTISTTDDSGDDSGDDIDELLEKERREEELFGSFEADVDEDGNDIEVEVKDQDATHSLTFEFKGSVVFIDKDSFEPFMEIIYNTTIEQDVVLEKKRFVTKTLGEIKTEVIGESSSSELFTCLIEIDIAPQEFEVITKLNIIPETEDADEITNLAVKIKTNKDYKEDWTSLCTDTFGNELNTKGDYEYHNKTILNSIKPSIAGLVFEDFIFGNGAVMDLDFETYEIDDEAVNEILQISGSGSVSVETL